VNIELLLGILLPAVVALGALLVAWRPLPEAEPEGGQGWGPPLALWLGYAAGHWALRGFPPFPPAESLDWLFWLAWAAGAAGCLEAAGRSAGWVRFATRALVSAAAVWLILRARLQSSSGLASAGLVAATGCALLALWALLEGLAERRPGSSLPLVLWTTAAASSVSLVLSGSVVLGQLAGALAAALGALVVVSWWRPAAARFRGAPAVAAVALGGLWISGAVYSELPLASALLLAAAPVAAWEGEAPAVRRLKPWQATLARFLAALIPAAVAVAIAFAASPSFEGV
jgi:hypothetical protein